MFTTPAVDPLPLAGTLGFDGGYTVINQYAPGVLTSTAAPGATVSRGGVLYSVDGHPVRLLYGGTPAFRAFAAGMPDGPDVRELEANLAALERLDFSYDELAEIDKYATESGINLWAASSSV
jgi:hypothetical protein